MAALQGNPLAESVTLETWPGVMRLGLTEKDGLPVGHDGVGDGVGDGVFVGGGVFVGMAVFVGTATVLVGIGVFVATAVVAVGSGVSVAAATTGVLVGGTAVLVAAACGTVVAVAALLAVVAVGAALPDVPEAPEGVASPPDPEAPEAPVVVVPVVVDSLAIAEMPEVASPAPDDPPLPDGVPAPPVAPTAAPLDTMSAALTEDPVPALEPPDRLSVVRAEPGVARLGTRSRSEDCDARASDVKTLAVLESLLFSSDTRLLPVTKPSATVKAMATTSCVQVLDRKLRRVLSKGAPQTGSSSSAHPRATHYGLARPRRTIAMLT